MKAYAEPHTFSSSFRKYVANGSSITSWIGMSRS
jgi:hypothetical protein